MSDKLQFVADFPKTRGSDGSMGAPWQAFLSIRHPEPRAANCGLRTNLNLLFTFRGSSKPFRGPRACLEAGSARRSLFRVKRVLGSDALGHLCREDRSLPERVLVNSSPRTGYRHKLFTRRALSSMALYPERVISVSRAMPGPRFDRSRVFSRPG
jgi:hypothetical protein